VLEYQQRAADEGHLRKATADAPSEGWFVPPALATALPPDSAILREEIFGPLVSLEPVPSIEAACDIVDGLDYALTGGLFSRNPDTVDYVVSRTPVGNLYVNRQITGAMVGRQPFGGNRLSGNGFKAGGPDYLFQFVDPQVVTEDTVRHGLVV
jgi:RHH-type proline utilization regulon transcriptional repressor/proline dehydrogenase/delta 1-pyrroline-5-carboxylate dehydrogenase